MPPHSNVAIEVLLPAADAELSNSEISDCRRSARRSSRASQADARLERLGDLSEVSSARTLRAS